MTDTTTAQAASGEALESALERAWDQSEDAPEVAAPEAPAAEGEDAAPAKTEEAPPEPEVKSYDSLDAYLKENQIDPEGFLSIPVSVKVDGKEELRPLSEVVKGYQIASAGYQRLSEAAAQKESFQREQQQVREALGQRIQQAEALFTAAQQQMLGDYQRINWQQLRAENPAEYAALSADFSQRQQALQQYVQQIGLAKQQEAQAAEQSRSQVIPAEREKLLALRPEWRDPVQAKEAQDAITSLGHKLGFSDAELNSITDHRQMLALDMAARYAKLQAAQPAKLKQVRAAPQMAKPGTRSVRNPAEAQYQNIRETVVKSGYRDPDAVAAMFERLAQ